MKLPISWEPNNLKVCMMLIMVSDLNKLIKSIEFDEVIILNTMREHEVVNISARK